MHLCSFFFAIYIVFGTFNRLYVVVSVLGSAGFNLVFLHENVKLKI